jgi:hypothetical protein
MNKSKTKQTESRKLNNTTYAYALTLGAGSNDREDAGDAYGIYLRKRFYTNELYVKKNLKEAYHIPTKKARALYGDSNLHVVIFKNCMPAKESDFDGFRWMYEAKQTIWMPLLEFQKWYGKLPTLNSGGIKAYKL